MSQAQRVDPNLPPYMVHQQTRSVPTKLGHMLFFEAGVKRRVAWDAIAEAQASGAIIVGDDGRPDEELTSKSQIFAVASDLRRSILLKIIYQIVARNDPAEFDAGGAPKLEALKMYCPLPTDISERDDLFTLYKKAQTDPNVVIQWHHATEAALEALNANTRNDIKTIAKQYGIEQNEVKKLDALPVADAKARLVALLANYKEE